MKKNTIYCLLLICLTFPVIGYTQKSTNTINNPATPRNSKDAGKIIQLEEVLRIDDQNGDYYFKFPSDIKIAQDKSIFILDNRQLLKFNSNGKFVKNFFKYGQGPSEVQYISNFILLGDQLHLHDSAQNKVIVFNHKTGEKLNEFRFRSAETGSVKLLYYVDNNYYFYRADTPETKGKPEFVNLDVHLLRIDSKGESITKAFSFPVRYFVMRAGERFISGARARFITYPKSKYELYLSHTQEYMINVYNIKNNSIINRFSRDYNRIEVTDETRKYTPGGGIKNINLGGDKWFKMPVDKYHLDIQCFFVVNGNLWVITSTTKKDNVLVDVYDRNYSYIDNFYLKCPSGTSPYQIGYWFLGTDGELLYFSEEDKKGNKYIKVNRILK